MKKYLVFLTVAVLLAALFLVGSCAEGPGDDDEEPELCCLCHCYGLAEECKEIDADTIKLKDRDNCDVACKEDLCLDPCRVDEALIENCD